MTPTTSTTDDRPPGPTDGPVANHHADHPGFAGPGGAAMGLLFAAGGRRNARLAADLAAVGPGDRVVDVGCGPGTAVREAGRRGARAAGVDPAPVMLSVARAADLAPAAVASAGPRAPPRRSRSTTASATVVVVPPVRPPLGRRRARAGRGPPRARTRRPAPGGRAGDDGRRDRRRRATAGPRAGRRVRRGLPHRRPPRRGGDDRDRPPGRPDAGRARRPTLIPAPPF